MVQSGAKEIIMTKRVETTLLAAGCFWCVEAVFSRIRGVEQVVSGYAGGTVENPTYQEVCSGTTGHAEVVRITFDPEVISLAELLEVFWHIHDPTTLNRQGADAGTQYRSAIFYLDERQKEIAANSLRAAEEAGFRSDPIVTEIVPFSNFYPAEDVHQNYFEQNSFQPYCRMVIDPKIRKLQKDFAEKLKAPPA
jgi:peptide-methionine (S)-S-oxide reductase